MKNFKKKAATLLLSMMMVLGACGVAAAGGVVQNATVSGTVVADSLVQQGQSVSEGQILVKVNTIAGAMPAARATVSGTISRVLVVAGQNIASGQAVAEITR